MSFADLIAVDAATRQEAGFLLGRFVRLDGVQAVVNTDGSQITVPTVGHYSPVPGENVWLLRVGRQVLMVGPANPRETVGRVTATGSPRITVEYPSGSGVTELMPYLSGYTPAVNDIVLINWGTAGGAVVGKLTTAPDVVTPTDPGGSGAGTHTQVFTATDSGTFYVPGGRWNTREVWSVTTGNNVGAWFYGNKVRDTIPDTATIRSVEIYLPLFYSSGSAPVARVHTSASKPGGNVSVTGGTRTLNPRSGWSALPTAFVDHMKTSGGGVALVSGGWVKYRPVASDALSGALRVTWTA